MITKTRLPYLITVLTYPLADAIELACLTHHSGRSMQRNLKRLIDDGLVAAVHRGTPTIPPTLRYYPTGLGMRVAAQALGIRLGELVRRFPLSRQWLESLSARIDTAATTYRIASSIAKLIDTTRPIDVVICRDKALDAAIRLPDGRLIGIVRQGVVARRKSISWRIRALRRMPFERFPSLLICLAQTRADANRTRRYGERGWTGRRFFAFQENIDLLNGTDYSERNIEKLGLSNPSPQPWSNLQFLLEVHLEDRKAPLPDGPRRSRATIPEPAELIENQYGMSLLPAEIRAFDAIALWAGMDTENLSNYLSVSESRIASIMTNLIHREGLVHDIAPRGASMYVTTYDGIRYWTARERAASSPEFVRWGNAPEQDIKEWEGTTLRALLGRERRHTRNLHWIVSQMARELHDAPNTEFLWALPARRGRIGFFLGKRRSILPDATVATRHDGTYVPYLVEFERSATGQVRAENRLKLYQRLHRTDQAEQDCGASPWILFVFPTARIERTFVRAANESWTRGTATPPVLTSHIPLLRETGVLGQAWHDLWDEASTERWLLPWRPPSY